MQAFKKIIKKIGNGILFSIPLSFLISIFTLPFAGIKSNRYISEKFFNTILSYLFKVFLPILPFVIIAVILFLIIFPKFKPENFKITKIIFVVLSSIVFVLFLFNFHKKIEKKPNLIFIVVDTLRDDHTSFEDPDLRTTENLKAVLLKDGVYFMNSHSNAPWTLPSISSMLTSRYPSAIGVKNLVSKISDKEFTLTELMKEEGYKTCSIISHILLKKIYGLSQGYDIYNERNISDKFGNHYSISSPGVTNDAVDFIRSNRNNKFFLFLHYFDPHYIYMDHEKSSGYRGPFTSKDISFLRKQIRTGNYSKKDIEYLKYCYDTEIRFTDKYISKFISELKKLDIFNNSLIIFTSDHGEEFIERGWLGHSTTLNSEQTNVPLIIKLPEHNHINVKKYMNMNISNIDIVPTITSILNIRDLPGFSGKNIFSQKVGKNFVFAEVSQKEFGTDIELISVIWEEWKLIKDLKNRAYQLFNINKDPKELNNLYGSFPQIESKLKLKIAKWIEKNRRGKKVVNRKKPLSKKEREKLKTLGYIN